VITVLAVDPGSRKCGLALVCQAQGILRRQIVPTEEIEEVVRQWLAEHSPNHVLVGGSTTSKAMVARLRELGLNLTVVDERHTTERARVRYFRDHPPRGLWRLVPLGLQVPREPVDDYAAVVMAEQFLDALPLG